MREAGSRRWVNRKIAEGNAHSTEVGAVVLKAGGKKGHKDKGMGNGGADLSIEGVEERDAGAWKKKKGNRHGGPSPLLCRARKRWGRIVSPATSSSGLRDGRLDYHGSKGWLRR